MKRILIAGIGNNFMGDDAFGVEVVRAFAQSNNSEDVTVVDYGIRPHDLERTLAEGYEYIILVDATPRGETPGTVSFVEPNLSRLDELEHEAVEANALNPIALLQIARRLGGSHGHIYLIGCEPARLVESEDGDLGLSESVHAAVPKAVKMIASLVEKILRKAPADAFAHNSNC